MPRPRPEGLPSDIKEWRSAKAKFPKVDSIHKLETALPASKIDIEQFLSFKILWSALKSKQVIASDGVSNMFGSSKNDLNHERREQEKHTEWTSYLEAIGANDKDTTSESRFSRRLGAYSCVLQAQLEVLRAPEPKRDAEKVLLTPRKLPTGMTPMTYDAAMGSSAPDEQIVNTAAFLFLNTVLLHDHRMATWTTERKQFKLDARVKLEARTDGHLKLHDTKQSAAILEVKSRTRPQIGRSHVEMQEGVQMALWIHNEPDVHWRSYEGGQDFHRVLVAQDRHHIYIIIAKYKQSYIDYLTGDTDFASAGFLQMTPYGPFTTVDANDMSWLAAVLKRLLAYAITRQSGIHFAPRRQPHLEKSPERGRKAPSDPRQYRRAEPSPLVSRGDGYEISSSTSSESPDSRDKVIRSLTEQFQRMKVGSGAGVDALQSKPTSIMSHALAVWDLSPSIRRRAPPKRTASQPNERIETLWRTPSPAVSRGSSSGIGERDSLTRSFPARRAPQLDEYPVQRRKTSSPSPSQPRVQPEPEEGKGKGIAKEEESETEETAKGKGKGKETRKADGGKKGKKRRK